VENERENVGKEYDETAVESTALTEEAVLNNKLAFLDAMATIVEGKLALFQNHLQTYVQIVSDIKQLRHNVCLYLFYEFSV
jgi:hypothetical protein